MADGFSAHNLPELINLKKILWFLGGGAALSSLIYFVLRGRERQRSGGPDMSDSDQTAGAPQVEEELLNKKILLLGLEGAGKSSILLSLQVNSMKVSEEETAPKPTEGFHVVCVQTSGADLNMWEIGGSDKMRKYWGQFIEDTDVLVFVVDSTSDEETLQQSGAELRNLLENPQLMCVPVIILANKQDLPGARPAEEVRRSLALTEVMQANREICEMNCSVPFQEETQGLDNFQAVMSAL